MPCSDSTVNTHYVYVDRDNPKLAAMLCGVLTWVEMNLYMPRLLDNLNYKEMGVTQVELETWWKKHKEEDKRRRNKEAAQKRREKEKRYNEYLKLKKEFG